jgi:hypothetical protein
MADIRISKASTDALKARLATPEGKAALLKLANLIAQTAVDAIPSDLRDLLKTKEGMEAFRAAWPDIVEAFLLRGASQSNTQRPGRDGRVKGKAVQKSRS